MKIDPTETQAAATEALRLANSNGPARTDAAKRIGESAAAKESTAASESSGKDLVQLSGFLEQLRSAGSVDAEDGSPERAALIERLREQVADGSYAADSKEVARGLVDEAIGDSIR